MTGRWWSVPLRDDQSELDREFDGMHFGSSNVEATSC